MGWGATVAACHTLYGRNNTRMQNYWTYRGASYFYEKGRERVDGAITGTIYRELPNNMARKVGTFKINPDGSIARAPCGMREWLSQD